jgi:hypothetical protein
MRRRQRVVQAGLEAAGVTWRSTRRTVRRLWFEVTGFLFAAFGVVGIAATMREYPAWAAGGDGRFRFLATAAFALLFTWFAVTSFLRSRRSDD